MRFNITSLLCASLCTFICNGALAENEKMVFAVDVIRHGDRAPIGAIPTAPYTGHTALGQLTPLGMHQEFELGTKLREQYVDRHGLLPDHYSPETMYVRSSDIDRTLMSAECVLLGLYPPGTGPSLEAKAALPAAYQPIPIHTIPRNEDNLLVIDFNPKLAPTVNEFVHDTPSWKEKTTNLQPQLKRWHELTGINLSGLRDVGGLGDTLFIYQQHHVPLPKGLSNADATEIMKEGEWAFAESFKPHQVGDVTSHELLKAIVDYFEEASQEKSKLKFVLFSGHDTTIAGLLSALRAPGTGRPPYSSDLNFALFKEGSEYKVKINLNGKPITLPGTTSGECTLKEFNALLESKS